jgi:hypothetical protein
MADTLATAEELATLMNDAGIDEDQATLVLELATAEVQAAAGQRLVYVEDDPIEVFSFSGPWLTLKERPVTEITSLTIDDGDELVAGTDYKRPANSATLFRRCGWAECQSEPSILSGVYSHGYATGDQKLEFARSAMFGIAKLAVTNPSLAESEAIDDYRIQYAAAVVWAMEQSPYLRKALQREYGDRAGLVRFG